jgi:hypothetical protein
MENEWSIVHLVRWLTVFPLHGDYSLLCHETTYIVITRYFCGIDIHDGWLMMN